MMEKYFADRVVDKDGCLEWTLSTNAYGYPQIKRLDGRGKYVVRYLLEKKLGREFSADEVAHHRCRNRRCINVDHIEILGRSDHGKLHPARKKWPITVSQYDDNAEYFRQLRKFHTMNGKPLGSKHICPDCG